MNIELGLTCSSSLKVSPKLGNRDRITSYNVCYTKLLRSMTPDLLYWLVCATMAKLELVGTGSQGKGQYLVPQTDAEDGLLPQELFNSLYT